MLIPASVAMAIINENCIELAKSFKRYFPKGDYPRKKDLMKWLHLKNKKYIDQIWKHAQGVNI